MNLHENASKGIKKLKKHKTTKEKRTKWERSEEIATKFFNMECR